MLEVPVVGTFIGKDKDKNLPANLEEYARVWPEIVKFAGDHHVKIAIENCPMIFSMMNGRVEITWQAPLRFGRRCGRSFRMRTSG